MRIQPINESAVACGYPLGDEEKTNSSDTIIIRYYCNQDKGIQMQNKSAIDTNKSSLTQSCSSIFTQNFSFLFYYLEEQPNKRPGEGEKIRELYIFIK